MKLKVIGSNSTGNCYLLENDNEALLIECGVKLSKIKKAINFNISKISGCIVTHEHLDHSVSINEVMESGINVYASNGTFDKSGLTSFSHRMKVVKSKTSFNVGNFKILPFDVKHDASEPLGFLINHNDCGNVLFLTDTYYSPYTFKGLNNIIIEANYSKRVMNEKMSNGTIPEFLRNRILKSHMSLETCMSALEANDLKAVNNIVLIHLSDSNSDEKYFLNEVTKMTSKNVHVADAGMTINFNKNPF